MAHYLKSFAGLRQLQQAPRLFLIRPNLPRIFVATHKLVLRPGKRISDFFKKPALSMPKREPNLFSRFKGTFCTKWTPFVILIRVVGAGGGAIFGGGIGILCCSNGNKGALYGAGRKQPCIIARVRTYL